MNKRDWIVLSVLVNYGYRSHRDLAGRTGYSLGLINSSLKKLAGDGYLDQEFSITDKTRDYMEQSKPRRAIILAAGMGLRMMPIRRVPKGLLKISGEPLIERIIKHLHKVGIHDISVVVGFMRESFEYLSDQYGVELIHNQDYNTRDSLHSLSLAEKKLSNCYIVPCNVWFARNPFQEYEYFSWYAVSEYMDDSSYVRLNRKMELVYTEEESGGNAMVGLCYLREPEALKVREQLLRMSQKRRYQKAEWEQALFSGEKMLTYARVMLGQSAFAICTYEQLRELDSESQDLHSKRMKMIGDVFGVVPEDITEISVLNKGMTNRLMRFSINDEPYLLRVPGEGSNELADRWQEAEVYHSLEGANLTDRVIYISPDDGHKITVYWENSRVCDPNSEEDVAACIRHLRSLHDKRLKVSHSFDLLDRLEQYEALRGAESAFADYAETRGKLLRLLNALEHLPKESCLCHIDSVSDNFLFVDDSVYLIDWEYAGMCDPHIDIAMFCLYADYPKAYVDHVMELYFGGVPDDLSRFKVYAYASAAGFLWTVWCEYKDKLGVNYGEYAMQQYRYAKTFYRYAMELAGSSDELNAAVQEPVASK